MSRTKKSGDPRLKNVPSVDELLRTGTAVELRTQHGLNKVTALARSVTSTLRNAIRDNSTELASESAESLLAEATRRLTELASLERRQGIAAVINATGVILHTNLGRAPLSESAKLAMTTQAAGYCTLEYDSGSGMRGKRGARVESLLRDLTGAEDALVVNNCAAAALLILGVIGRDGETLVSRGELVEIGGDFRVPDVMASSGTRMVEVGTTNKTHLDDYRKAITSKTRLVMRVHPSNYRVVGFTSAPSTTELASLAHEVMLPFYEDAGSGQLIDLSGDGIKGEPIISNLISAGADLVSFSGDKLLGSVQAGLIVGKRGLVDRLRRHPLYRALRSDKVRLAALEATLIEVQQGRGEENIPVLKMLSLTREDLRRRTEAFVQKISNPNLQIEVQQSESAVGGGAGPTADLPTVIIVVAHSSRSAQEIETALRSSSPAIIGRVSDDRVLLDLRTVFPHQEAILLTALDSV
jgi:L-seryl-tRNA(Ser) seleniumtransferase